MGAPLLLAVDIGNTNTVAGVFAGEDLVAKWRINTDARRTADEYASLAATLFHLRGLDPASIAGVVVAGVVPAAQSALSEASRQYFGTEPLVVSTELNLGIAVLPPRVGADRLANAVAARQRYGAPAIVADFGTGTNFDVVAADGTYLGGAIAPGLEIGTEALFAKTAQLPQVPLTAPRHAIGSDTISALQSGIIYGYAGLVDGLVQRLGAELEGKPHVIATGGLADVIAPHTRSVEHIDLDLTLHGLRLLYLNNHDSSDPASTGED